MKYARLVFSRSLLNEGMCNIGDIAQTLAIDEIYKKMNLPPEQIINIPMESLGSYKGETAILPMNGYFRYSREFPAFPTSECIRPVFLGTYTTSKKYLSRKSFWKQYGPVGCRDEATLECMKAIGADAFLSGCMTVLFPKRTETPSKKKVFLVDIHPKAEPHIPESIKKDAEWITHDVPVDVSLSETERAQKCEETARSMYRRYFSEATLVITSRLHCAVPCLAMGIPVIVMRDAYDERFTWLNKLLPLYTPETFHQIDWNPAPRDIEELKALVMETAVSMLRLAPDASLNQKLHSFYMDREHVRYKASFMVRGYMWLAQYAPHLALFIREKILFRFTITSHTEKHK